VARATSDTELFFATLASRGQEQLLQKVVGTIRFDAVDGQRVEHWYVALDRGDVKVSRKNAKADAVIRGDTAILDGIFSGRENAMAALLRGALIPEGDPALLLRFERIFAAGPHEPAAPATDDPRSAQ